MGEIELQWQSAGHEATSRCEAIDKIDKDSTENDELQRELQQYIPQPGSNSESSQLQRLRAIQGKIGESSSSLQTTNTHTLTQLDKRRQRLTREKGRDGETIETELHWSSTRLIWSRGGAVIRSFSYEEDVKCACWAWMDSDSTWEKSEVPAHSMGARKEGREDVKNLSSISTTRAKQQDSDPLSHLQQRFRQTTFVKSAQKQRRLYRALCVFLSSCLVIYHPHSGKEYMKRLDLDVLNVFPLDVGFLVQRATEEEDRKRSRLLQEEIEGAEPPLSTLFYLRRPYDEFKGVECVETMHFSRNKALKLHASIKEGEKSKVFNEPEEKVIFVSIEPPILVSTSRRSGSIRIYAYAHDRSPLHRYDANSDVGAVTTGTSDKQEDIVKPQSGGAAMARRSTIEGQVGRSGQRPRLPSRKSSRIESVGGRSSMGGPRSSTAGDRSRTTSATGHLRRTSGGLTSIYGQSALLHNEDEQRKTEAEDMQEMMQLLDEFDEVAEENDDSQQGQQQPPFATPAPAPSTAARRRISRAFTSVASNVPPAVANTIRTPFTKTRALEERRISRSRMSMPAGNSTEGNPISLAMELSQKDEASKLAMTANGEKTSSKVLSGEVTESDEQTTADGLPIFQEFAQGFAAMSLLEEILVPEMHSLHDIESAKAFIQAEKEDELLHVVLPFCSKIFIRQIVEQRIGRDLATSFVFRSIPPPLQSANAEVRAQDAFLLHSKDRQDLILIEGGPNKTFHLVAGPPGFVSSTIPLQLSEEESLRTQQMPVEIASEGSIQVNIVTEASCSMTAKVFALCEAVLKPLDFRQLRGSWIQVQAKDEEQQWSALVNLLLCGNVEQPKRDTLKPWDVVQQSSHNRSHLDDLLLPLIGAKKETQQKSDSGLSITARSDAEVALLLQGLNLIAQAARLDVCERACDMGKLCRLIFCLINHLGWRKWYDYWARLVPSAVMLSDYREHITPVEEEREIMDIYDLTGLLLKGHSIPLPAPSDLLSRLPHLKKVVEIFSCYATEAKQFATMSGAEPTPTLKTAKAVVDAMLRCRVTSTELRRLPFAIAAPLQEAIKCCQRQPPSHWSAEAYLFIDREDLAREITAGGLPHLSQSFSAQNSTPTSEPNRLFPNDYRLKEVTDMLQTSRPIATRGPDVTGVEDQEVIAEQQKRVFVSASDRIKSLSVGRGMLSLSSVAFKSTEQWKTAPICLRIRMLNNCIVQHREPDAEGVEMAWPEFHNGVASALQLAISQDKIESSWLYSQFNKEFNSRHAGLMFGIGLLGQLRNLGKIHAHFYLSNRHSITTIGILLGISLSFLGTCDPLAKALMSIHLIHTLPAHSRPLKTSMLEQSAALVGLGFVFLASKDRWASRMAFKAIGTDSVMTDDDQMLKRECFSLSSAFALGLICLGKGREGSGSLGGEIEKEIIPGLERLIKVFSANVTSDDDDQQRERAVDEKKYSAFEWKPEISLTTTPASIALALIYLKSNRKDKVERMPLPETTAQLDHIRPDMLVIRALCRSLIAWDDITPNATWLDQSMPPFLQLTSINEVRAACESCQMAYWSLRLGFIFAIGLKYAGSNDKKARSCLMEELQRFQSQVDLRPNNYFDKIRQQTLQSSVDVILTCLSMVLAGTGDIEVLQHLRRSLYRINTLRYGNYMASSMSIGMLFLGAGRFTLSTSDSAIAALLISFYPRYPINAQDNRCHLQAYRHLWLLAVEARLLSVEDVESGESSQMPVEMKLTGQSEIVTGSTPCLLPKLEDVESIQIASDRYFSSKLDLKGNAGHQKTVIETRKLYVKRKAAQLSHDEDEWGTSSLYSKTRRLPVCTQMPLTSEEVNVEGLLGLRWQRMSAINTLRELIRGNTYDKGVHQLIDVVCRGSSERPSTLPEHSNEQEEALELFTLQSILECLVQDKQEILPSLIKMWTSTQAILKDDINQEAVFFVGDLKRICDDAKESVVSLIDCEFVESLQALLRVKMERDLDDEVGKLRASLVKYIEDLGEVSNKSTWISFSTKERQKLACLLVILDVPPMSVLLNVKEMAVKTGISMDKQVIVVVMKDILGEMGYKTSKEVVKLLVESWCHV